MADIQSKSPELPEKYQVKSNTLEQLVKNNPKDKIQVEIGDIKQPDFKPQVKIMRWDNEVNFSMRAEEHPDAVVEVEGEKIKYITSEYEVHQYDKPEAGEDGGHEFEWILKQQPFSNVLTATIQTKELDFFFQPPLTQEEIDEGQNRPENVIGSYAVYHATKGGMNDVAGMEYKTGKAFHIYRPKVTDANGVETWGELNIDEANGVLTVTIDQAWLDKAVYPVMVDPTFGYTGIGASVSNIATTTACLRKGRGFAYAGGAATVVKISAAIHASSDVGRTVDTTVFINLENTGTDSHDEIVKVENVDNATTGVAAFYDFTAASQSISDNYYILNIVANEADIPINNLEVCFDTGLSVNQYSESNATYATIRDEAPWTETDAAGTPNYSIYATHTGSGQFTWNNYQFVRSVSAGIISVGERIR